MSGMEGVTDYLRHQLLKPIKYVTGEAPNKEMGLKTKIIDLRTKLIEIIVIKCAEGRERNIHISPIKDVCKEIIFLDWPENLLGVVFRCLDFADLLHKNEEAFVDVTSLKKIQDALSMLFKYGINLLRPATSPNWRVISFDNVIYLTIVTYLEGHKAILNKYGYTKEMPYGLSYPHPSHEPNIETVKNIAADLAIAFFQIEFYISQPQRQHARVHRILKSKSADQKEHVSNPLETDSMYSSSSPEMPAEEGKLVPPARQVPRTFDSGIVSDYKRNELHNHGSPNLFERRRNDGQPDTDETSRITRENQFLKSPSSPNRIQGVREQSSGASSFSSRDFDDILKVIAKSIHDRNDIDGLGVALGFETSQRHLYASYDRKFPHQYDGTLTMLRDWRKRQSASKEREALRDALQKAGLIHLSELLLPSGDSVVKDINLKTCGICKQKLANVGCDMCSQPRCQRCDELWHKHPQRQGHTRHQIIPEEPEAPGALQHVADISQRHLDAAALRPVIDTTTNRETLLPAKPSARNTDLFTLPEVSFSKEMSVSAGTNGPPDPPDSPQGQMGFDLMAEAPPANCDFCGTKPGKKFCATCGDTYCLECDEKRHSNQKRKNHERQDVTQTTLSGNSSNVQTMGPDQGNFELPQNVLNTSTAETESQEHDSMVSTCYSVPGVAGDGSYIMINSEEDLDVRAPPNDTYRLPMEKASVGASACTTQPRKSPDFEESPYMYVTGLRGGGRAPQDISVVGTSKQMALQAEQDRITAEDIDTMEKLLSVRDLRDRETDPVKKADLLREEQKLTRLHEEFEKKLRALQGQSPGTQGASPQGVQTIAAIAAGAVMDVPQGRAFPRVTLAGNLPEIRQEIPAPAKALRQDPKDRHQADLSGWTCIHCTFLNTNMESNICELCDKTSFPKAKIKPTVRPKDTKPEQSKSDSEVRMKPATKAEIRKKNAEYYQQLEAEMLAEKQLAKEEYFRNPGIPQADPTVKEPKKAMEKPKPLSDTDLLELAQQINNEGNNFIRKLGFELGFSQHEISRLQVRDPTGIAGGGIFEMLKMWSGDVRKQEQRPKLKKALVNAGLPAFACILEENRFTEDEPRMSSPKAKIMTLPSRMSMPSAATMPDAVSDEELIQLSRRIPTIKIHELGCYLGIGYSKVQSYLHMHLMDHGQTILHMLHEWKIRTEPSNQCRELNMILIDCDLGGLALTEVVSIRKDDPRMSSPKAKTIDGSMTLPSRMSTPSAATMPDAVSEKELIQLSKRIPFIKIHDLGFKLQFQYPEVQAYMHMHRRDPDDAILHMLQEWQSRTKARDQRRELNNVLIESELGGLALKEFVSKPKDESKEPRGITDMELYELADSLNAGNIKELGLYLGFGMAAIFRYQQEAAAMESPREGTRRMLFDWKNHKPETDQRNFLSNVLDQIGCGRLGEKIRNYSVGFTQHHDTFEESLQKQLSHATSFGDLSYVKDEEKMRYEEMRTASLKRIAELREAESQGIHPERLKCALYIMEEYGDDGRTDPIDWIAVNWSVVVHDLAQKATVELRENLEVDVDAKIMELVQVSAEAAEKCLEDCSGNTQEAVKECAQRTQEKILEILEVGCYSLEDIVTILKLEDVKGDAEKALEALQVRAMTEYTTRVWTPTDEDDNEYFQKAVKNDDRSIRMLMVEYNMRSWGRAQTAAKLVVRKEFAVDDVMIAAEECGDVRRSLVFLKQECSVCYIDLPRNKLMSLINCQCMICRECIIERFSIIARDESIMKGKCPSCDEPNLDDTAVAADYFAFLDILLREMLPPADFELFTRKLRDWNLMHDENFCWCAHCNSGFLNGAPERRKMRCPECNKLTCFLCKKQWMDQHEGISCEAFQEWKENNDPDLQAQGLAAHLNENGIECPRCKMRYELAKGGCMHFKCPHCTFEFCSGCNQPMKKGEACNKFASCLRKGLHAHHPRDCLFYLRDEDIAFLKKLLEDANVKYNKEPPQGAEENEEGVCGVKEQKDGPNGLEDNTCGRKVTPGNAGLCRIHYIEYLVGLINGNQIDPAKSFPINQLEPILMREEIPVPVRRPDEADPDYRGRLLTVVQTNLPLKKSPRDRPR